MFPARYFAPRYFAERYFASVGGAGVALDGTYYFHDVNGDDGGVGSIGDPFQTEAVLNSAASIAAGTEMNWNRDGSFGEVNAPAYSGSDGLPITMQPYGSGNEPVFTASADAVIDLGANDYWTIKNLRLTGGLQPGLNKTVGGGVFCNAGTGIVLDDLTIDNCYGAGVLAKEVADFTVQNCDISEITGDGGGGHGDAITIRPTANKSVLSTNVTISGNTVHGSIERQAIALIGVNVGLVSDNTITTSATIKGTYAIALEPNVDSTVANVVVRDNDINVTVGGGIGIGGAASGASVLAYTVTGNDIDLNNSAAHMNGIVLLSTDGTLSQNVVSENAVTGAHWGILASGAGTVATLKHNEISGPHADSSTGIYVTDGASVEIFSGVVSGHKSSIVVFGGASEAVVYNLTMVGWTDDYAIGNWVTLTVRNCIFYATAGNSGLMVRNHGTLDINYNDYYDEDGAASWREGANTYNSLVEWQAATSDDANSQDVDPLFLDQDNGKYSLQPGSPSISGGEDLGDDYKWGLSPTTTFPSNVVLLNRNVYGWDVGAYIAGRAAFTLVEAETYQDGAFKAETYLDGGIEAETCLDGAILAQTEPS